MREYKTYLNRKNKTMVSFSFLKPDSDMNPGCMFYFLRVGKYGIVYWKVDGI